MSKRLILHIGAEKTATTFIQNYFSVNRENYKETGVLYPKTSFGEHAQFSLIAALHELDHGFGLEFAPQDKNYTIESEWNPLIERLNKQTRFHTVILSAEHFSSRLKEKGLKKLGEILEGLEGYDIEVIYYFRRQDDFFQSWYSTHIKAGGCKTLEKALEDDFKNPWFFDVGFLIGKWKEVFPKAKYHIRPYDFVSKNIGMIDDVTSQLNLPKLNQEITPNLDRNESWPPEMIAMARIVNEYYQSETGDERFQILELIAKRSQFDNATKSLLSVETKKKILAEYENSNRQLCSDFKIDYNKIFAEPINTGYLNPDEIEVSPHELSKILLKVIKESL